MSDITIHAAKTNLSRLIERAERGEEVVISRGTVPVARLVAYAPPARRRFGALRGKVALDDGFFEPLPAAEQEGWDGTA